MTKEDLLLAFLSFIFAALCAYLGQQYKLVAFHLLGMLHLIGFMLIWPLGDLEEKQELKAKQ